MNRGIVYALLAYGIWGFFPLYWKQLDFVPPGQQTGHRIIWSLAFLLCLMPFGGRGRRLLAALGNRKLIPRYLLSAGLIGVNWLVYLWAVTNDAIVEASLGYFINPLLNVVLGVVFLRERLRRWQCAAVGIATLGVLYLTFAHGRLPWIALILAAVFSLYGLARKTSSLGSTEGLTLEMALLLVPTAIYMLVAEFKGVGAFGHRGLGADLLMMGTGIVTTTPLLFFIGSARRIPLSVLGMIQYITPTCQLLLGVCVYGEPFSHDRVVGFSFVWLALLVFSLEGFAVQRRKSKRSVSGGRHGAVGQS